MKKHKSLLIIGLPRSGSTAFEFACTQILKPLGFKNCGEFLNGGFKHNKIRFGHNSRKEKIFAKIKSICKSHVYNCVVRDVVQTTFVVKNIKWLSSHFNIIYIVRPQKEIRLCCKLVGWRPAIGKLGKALDTLPESLCKRFDYYDFVFGPPKRLHKIMRRWYPKCQKVDYLTKTFVQKRYSTIKKIERYGIRPKRKT